MDKQLYEMARKARENAYAPYSNFKVGAAVRGSSGRSFCGCNVENVSFGLTCCAERVAIFEAVAAGEKELTDLCVVGDTTKPIAPCGACRQVMIEFNIKNVFLSNCNGKFLKMSLNDLMPYPFKAESSKNREE